MVHEVIFMRRGNPQEGYIFAADNATQAVAFDANNTSRFTIINALFVPLVDHSLVLPPPPNAFWSVSELRTMVRQHLSVENTKRIDDRVARGHKYEEVIVLKIPRPSGGEVLVGVQCLGVETHHPLHLEGIARQLTPIRFKRKDPAYLLPRAGAKTRLAEKRVAVIGCGSVGGHIAVELVRLGVLNLALVDPDRLSVENIFRHVLGKTAVGSNKAVALRDEIKRQFPYVTARAHPECIERVLDQDDFHPEEFDLIIVAVGEVPLSLFLNQYFYDHSNVPPVLYTWVEALGIGGHALLTLNECRKGCLECLYTPSVDGDFADRSSFAAPGQSFAKDLSGCATLFTPYSSLDAVRTAVLAVEAAGNTLMGTLEGNQLLSWKGNQEAFVAAGYSVSTRYELTEKELFERRYQHPSQRCPVCGGDGE